jgi:hypothetical protein
MDNFGGTSLAWDSMGLEAHRLDAKGPYVRSQRHAFGGLEDTLEDLTQPLHAKRFS